MTKVSFLTTKEAAVFLSVSEKQLRNLTSSGKVRYFKFGRLNRYKLADLISLIESHPRGLVITKNFDKEDQHGN